jgi:hypothetical protein
MHAFGFRRGELWPGRRPLGRTTALGTGPKPFWHQTLANTSQKALDTSNGGLRVASVCDERLFLEARYVTLQRGGVEVVDCRTAVEL